MNARAASIAAEAQIAPIEERAAVDPDTFEREILVGYRPVVLRGQMNTWPAVAAGKKGPRPIIDYVRGFASDVPSYVMIGPPGMAGRFFYSDDMRGFNFKVEPAPLPVMLTKLLELADKPDGHTVYAGAASTSDYLPGWDEANPLGLPLPDPTSRVWIGNATHVSAHYDLSNNVACVVAGTRRFTLFPPDQIDNLYIGPLDMTTAGRPASLVNLIEPDLDRYPRFATALEHAQTADLEPGDAIFIPTMWWHNVQSFAPINVMVNYWSEPADTASPFPVLLHALLALRDLPAGERAAWRDWFDHYVFDDDATERVTAHIPDHAQSVLGPASAERDRKIAAYLSGVFGKR